MNKKVSKQFKDIKDIYLLRCICTEQNDEIERLNNIVNKLDKLIEQYSKNDYYYKYNGKYLKSEIINDLKELKGSDKE